MIFDIKHKKSKKYAKESDLLGWNDVTVWKDFKPPYISETVWVEYIRELESANSLFHYHTHWQLHSVCFICEADGKIFFNYINFLIFL